MCLRKRILLLLLLLVALAATAPALAEQVVTLYETEILQDVWRGASPSRWTSENGAESPPPNQMNPPSTAWRWLGDWKIVTGENRDSLGWEYLTNNDGLPLRRRVWLRTVQATKLVAPTQPYPKAPETKRSQKDQSATRPNLLIRRIRENWNFKGFGLTFYKSFLFWDSVGVMLSIPITYNFDWWERHPSLPSITTSACAYHPFMVIWFVNMSINAATITYILEQGLTTMRYFVILTTLYVMRAMIFPLVAFRSVQKNLNKDDKQNLRLPLIEDWLDQLRLSVQVTPWPYAPPTYNLGLRERVGISWSWRYSTARGYETRWTKWYLFLPTVLSLWDALIKPVLGRLFRQERRASKSALIDWLRQKTTSVGISTGVPTPVPPYFACSGLLYLSGLYFRRGGVGLGAEPVHPTLQSDDVDYSDEYPEFSDGVEFPADSEASVRKTHQKFQTRTTTPVDPMNRVLSH